MEKFPRERRFIAKGAFEDDVLNRLKAVLIDCLGEQEIGDNKLLRADLGMESIDMLEFIFLLQKEFDLTLDADDIIGDVRKQQNDVSVLDLALTIHQKLVSRFLNPSQGAGGARLNHLL